MRQVRTIILFICILTLTACQSDIVIPTPVELPTLVPTVVIPTATITPSPTPTASSTPLATATITPSPTITPTIGVVIELPTTPTPIPPTVAPTETSTPLPEVFIFGQSADGRDLRAYRYGTGRYIIMLVGGIHAGFEANTTTLMNELRTHYTAHPEDIARDVTLLIIPALNPDGASYGRVIRGRFNGNGVDLNRNWGCQWSAEAEFANGAVDPGTEPFSEPESTALGSLIQRVNPVAVLFYHSAANGVYAGSCDGSSVSDDLAELYGTASGYPYGEEFSAYTVTGTAPSWVDSIGIPSLDIELATATGTEFSRNFEAIQAVQQWATFKAFDN